MRLTLLTPRRPLAVTEAVKIVAEAPDGAFAVLPRHADIVTALSPGLLIAQLADGAERFFGLDEGILVKEADEVRISVLAGFESSHLDHLRLRVRQDFVELDEAERSARTMLARLEAGTIRRVLEIER